MPDWDGARGEIERTWKAAKNQPLEFVVRDVYDVDGDLDRISRWVDMTKEITGLA
jgi:hypothetical protein